MVKSLCRSEDTKQHAEDLSSFAADGGGKEQPKWHARASLFARTCLVGESAVQKVLGLSGTKKVAERAMVPDCFSQTTNKLE